MALVIVDTSLLLVLTMIQRLDLLARHVPIWISRSVRREHQRCAPQAAEAYLARLVDDASVVVRSPGVRGPAERLQSRYHALSFEDAEGLAWALQARAFLLAEDRRLLEAAEAEGADWVDLAALLFAWQADGMSTKDLKRLVAAIELDAFHTVSAAVKAALGV